MSWRRSKFLMTGFLASYLVIALLTAQVETGELFPFFNGHWFYKTPVEFDDFGLVVQELDGRSFQEITYLEQLYPRLMVWPFAAYGSVQRLGQSLERSSPLSEQQMQASKKLIFGSRKFKAQIVKRHMNPLDFVRERKVISAKVLIDVQN